ncbi:MAG: hypothetical protein JSS03_07530, partial [Proteobacteria bacterium]|nr:hypothetical protein [Pseudomonadota bacterium]
MPTRRLLAVAIFLGALALGAPASFAQQNPGDPPDRVARLSWQSGDVEFSAAGAQDWGYADVNRPLMTGDRLSNGDDGRAELELGGAAVRLDYDSAFDLTDLENDYAQIQLTQGSLELRVRRLNPGESYEIDTPTIAFVAASPGAYRIDVNQDGTTTVSVRRGNGTAYGQDGVSQQMSAGDSFEFDDPQMESVQAYEMPPMDAFDRFCASRDARYDRARRYVPVDMIGGSDLDQYGAWSSSSEYGNVWYPTQVAAGWAPYRDGHWVWIDPWGWTWVDNAPWGFAPFHYGRWVWVQGRWGWIPGPATARPVYAPALVAFVGGIQLSIGGGGPVGWFPLGPREVYVPPYQVSKNYFVNVNVTNVKVVNTTVINNYYTTTYINKQPLPQTTFANRTVPGAVTVVPATVFTSAKPVAAAAIAIKPAQVAALKVAPTLRIAPVAASLGARPSAQPRNAPAVRPFQKPVMALRAPPPPPAPFTLRAKAIASQGGAPLARTELRTLGAQQAASHPQEAPRPVLAKPGGGALQGAGHGMPVRTPAPAENGGRPPVPHPVMHQNVQPQRPAMQPARPAAPGLLRPDPNENPMRAAQPDASNPRAPLRPVERPTAPTPVHGAPPPAPQVKGNDVKLDQIGREHAPAT